MQIIANNTDRFYAVEVDDVLPPYAYIQRRKIERARQLLEERALSITEIAFRLGFPSSQHFAVRFKQMTSQTPSDFRRRKGAC